MTTSRSSIQPTSLYRQQGMALLTVLLLVVVITVVAGSMLASQKIALRKQMLLLEQNQVLQDIEAAEQIAVGLIQADATLNNSDSVQDVWAQPIKPIKLGTHTLNLSIQDASQRFNINNLYHDGAVDEVSVSVFQRLLSNLGLDPILAYTVLDWQDPDNETHAEGGAEREAYLSGQEGVSVASIANQPFVSIDELVAVKGFTPEAVAKLKPYVTTVPYFLPINVNTADAIVLSALVEGSDPAQFSALVKEVKQQPFESIDAVMQTPPFSTLDDEKKASLKPLLAVTSRAFYVLIDAEIEDKHRYATTFISKVADEGEDATGSSNTEASQQSDAQGQPVIRAYGRKIWTYRPDFIETTQSK
ncbi:type II secretion system minor pseudopilin GspK [Psychrobacter sp. I-STPA6b]|uniref:type II secretion system minor pseudopilin GspK n=1 Tax=Psychrobacter sp. I-STPA6b TaxID=2585718 RepID=UPI001D0C0F8F|nr:type II secretion system minor pseudopilin GspK [Psychrobacter sp. I-STPA6b]